ncbi:Flagellum-specific ATP synthase [Botrimarina colliarenosi]|uniref:Flagellum-specific ATP synthase n=1 Tax=Botrimarina colliarenosi TaxID=2528001 RepID=A0A5C6AL05_9BACT|nr:FliI/YscN family ATPase [Botrimarina colliarenosi]TWU00330.1 Flagellum-specific ATP synthase [Botrimarina colliarenosi]
MDDLAIVARAQPTGLVGSVVETTGLLATVADLAAPVGSVVQIGARRRTDRGGVEGEVVGFRGRLTMVSPLGSLAGVHRGQPVRLVRTTRQLSVGDALLGRVVNASGEPIDGLPRPALPSRVSVDRAPHPALDRPPIKDSLPTGVRAIDAMLTCGRGQRLGVFAGSGVGKSTLLGMMTRNTAADVVVIGLVGERGREVNEFLERDLGPEGRKKSVVVVATSDEPAPMRLRAASTATAIAEHFRDQGRDVLLLVDSLTRTALASRELGLAAGEPPTTRGYPPSTFALLPRLVERAGRTSRGSITAFYSVLVEGDDPDDPIADCLRGLLDGHVWLSRKIAARGHYPAIDITQSISRLMPEVTTPLQLAAAQTVRRLLAALNENADLISIGAYRRGADPTVDAAIELRTEIDALLQQKTADKITPEEVVATLTQLANKAAGAATRPRPANPAPTTTGQRT